MFTLLHADLTLYLNLFSIICRSTTSALNDEIEESIPEVAKIAYIVNVLSSCYVEVYEHHIMDQITGSIKSLPKNIFTQFLSGQLVP